MPKKLKLSTLIERIEKVDWGFEMSDNHSLYSREKQEIESIREEIRKLDLVVLNKLINHLTPYGMANWQRYFKMYSYGETDW